MSAKKLHMIGNAHIDPVWLWQWQEGFHEIRATFRSALDRMKEDEAFLFVASSAAFYEWIEHIDPAMFSEIKARVAEGRWEIVGGWWLEPDCNLPGGESFVRHMLYGQRYFQEKFGVTVHVAYNPDSFGHHAMLPQLLRQGGLEEYVFMRPGPHEKDLPGHLFWWESGDGSRVLAFRVMFQYETRDQVLEDHIRRCAEHLEAAPFDLMCFFGVGDHGGGPTRENIETIHRLSNAPGYPELVFSSPGRYFHALRAQGPDLPVVRDELQIHAPGCYAAHSGIKRWNRQTEHLLLAAEKFSALARRVTGQPYPDDLDRAWKAILFNQFHDILAGTSLEASYEDARNLYGEATSIAGRALNSAVQSLVWNIGVEPELDMTPVHVFNPNACPMSGNVEFEFGLLSPTVLSPGKISLVDEQDREIPIQIVQSEATIHGRDRLSFVADLPALGYRTYRLLSRAPARPVEAVSAGQIGEPFLESSHLRLVFDPQTGCIRSLVDRRDEVEIFAGLAARPVVINDESDTWSHGIQRFDEVIGAFQAPSIRLVERGPVKAVMRVTSVYGRSTLVQDFALYRDLAQVDVRVTVNWQEQLKMLKLRFPVNVVDGKRNYEIPFGHIERPGDGKEVPGQGWIDLSGLSADSGKPYGLSLLNDGKYSFDVQDNEIGMTVLRSPVYAQHTPRLLEAGRQYTYIDQGIQRFCYTLVPHTGDWRQADIVRHALSLNQRPIVVVGTFHPGPLPQVASFISVDCNNIVVSAMKQAEDNEDLIVRCYETHGLSVGTTIYLPAWKRWFQAGFGPYQIKTFRVPTNAALPVVETRLLEDITGEQQLSDDPA